jgi:SAM-dependent methyltransferase
VAVQSFAPYPDFVARFYDVVYGEVRHGVDSEFYARQMLEAGGPVLEIGVGTGRLFCDARQRGADVDGIDASPSMVARLHAKLAPEQRGRVRVADAVTLRLDRSYRLIVAPFRVLSHIPAVVDQLELLENVYQHLLPGGRFIFDLYVPSPKILEHGYSDSLDFDGEYAPGLRLQRYVTARSDIVRQVTYVTMRFVWDEDGGEEQAEWQFEMRFFFRYEIEHLLARSRLELETIHGDFAGSPLGADSKEFVVTCRRP